MHYAHRHCSALFVLMPPSQRLFVTTEYFRCCAVRETISGFSRMITTRGSAYVFIPSITGLNYLASLGGA